MPKIRLNEGSLSTGSFDNGTSNKHWKEFEIKSLKYTIRRRKHTHTNTVSRKMRVAVVQIQCDDTGNKEDNMKTLSDLLEAELGGVGDNNEQQERPEMLVLAPEFAICGYTYVYETMWKSAERQDGLTEQFVCEMAFKYKIFFGLSYLEVRKFNDDNNDDGGSSDDNESDNEDHECHFLNTFCLAGPNGTIQGRVSKATPCSVEAYFFRAPPPVKSTPSSSHHVIECTNASGELLRLGVLICYENYVSDSLIELQQGPQLDLLLQPFSGPLADDKNEYVKETLRQMYLDVCSINGQYLHCPTLYCNKIGTWKQPSPSNAMPMTFDTEFPGCSSIYDYATNEIVGRLGENEQGILSREVTLGTTIAESKTSSEKMLTIPRYWGGYTNPTPFLKVCILYEWLGSRSYKNDKLRKKLASEAWEKL